MDTYFDLGTYRRPVTTHSAEAQVWFDRGLMWCYGYNHEESVRCFQKAAELDPGCAMAYWGIAYAAGPNYNRPWEAFRPGELQQTVITCRAATDMALSHLASAAPVEQALIKALDQRYQAGEVVSEEEFTAWNGAYAAAMKAVHEAFPQDLEVSTLCAEADNLNGKNNVKERIDAIKQSIYNLGGDV
jgi:hypothetical protein